MFKKLQDNQSGAALMIVLFIVILVSIVGTTMLATTTYGLKAVEMTKQEQAEFYRAEGAIEIVMAEMEAYTNNDKRGPYAYLKEMTNINPRIINIGGKSVKVEILAPENSNNVNPGTKEQSVTVTLKANYELDSNVTRIVKFNVNVTTEGLSHTRDVYNLANYQEFIDTTKNNKNDRLYDESILGGIEIEDYTNIYNSLGTLKPQNNTIDFIGNDDVKNKDFIFSDGLTRVEDIVLEGKNHPIIIPENSVVYVNKIDLGGSGNSTQIVVNGALIVDELVHGGSSIITINSGMIVKKGIPSTSGFNINSENPTGISCKLLETACTVIDGFNSSNNYTSSIDTDPTKIIFSTDRDR